jgi:hypothetical protein
LNPITQTYDINRIQKMKERTQKWVERRRKCFKSYVLIFHNIIEITVCHTYFGTEGVDDILLYTHLNSDNNIFGLSNYMLLRMICAIEHSNFKRGGNPNVAFGLGWSK